MKIRRNKLVLFRLMCISLSVILLSSIFPMNRNRPDRSFDIMRLIDYSRIMNPWFFTKCGLSSRSLLNDLSSTEGFRTTPRVLNSAVYQVPDNSSIHTDPSERLSLEGYATSKYEQNFTNISQGRSKNESAKRNTLIHVKEDPREVTNTSDSTKERSVHRHESPNRKIYMNRNEHRGPTRIRFALPLNKSTGYVPNPNRGSRRAGPTSASMECLNQVLAPTRTRPMRNSSITNNLEKSLRVALFHLSNGDSIKFCEELEELKNEPGYNSTIKLSREEILNRVVQIVGSLGQEQRLPDVLGIGVKKSGTNALEHFLKQHPLVRVPYNAIELHFFDKYYTEGIEFYRSSLPFVNRSQLCLEKTPKYFVTETAPGNIKKDISSSVKFILCVRDPVERTLSDWRHERIVELNKQRAERCVNCTPESEGEKFTQRVVSRNGTVNASNEIIDTSNYARHFQRWLSVFPRDQFLVLQEEDISTKPYRALRRVEDFLGLPHFFREDMFVAGGKTKSICFKTPEMGKSCPPTYGPPVPKPALSDAVIQTLRAFYRPHNDKFEELTGMKFGWSTL